MAELRLLGSVELLTGGRQVDLGPAKQRLLLAATAVDAGHPVTVDTLIDRIWEESPPSDARGSLYTYIARVRRTLRQTEADHGGQMMIERCPGGYRLVVEAKFVDLHQFHAWVKTARGVDLADPGRADLLSRALRLWRGEALTGLPGAWAMRVRDTLRQQWLAAMVDWSEAELAQGRHETVIEQLPALVADNPLAESLAAALLCALQLAGRHTEALDVYARARRRIAEELGTEPGPVLQEQYRAILRDTAAPPRSAPGGSEPAGSRPAGQGDAPPGSEALVSPAQLPLGTASFVGRASALGRLDALATAASGPGSAMVCAIWGPAGIGKTTLAVYWAHRVRDSFPDGQLYVNLRGFDSSGSPTSPFEAVRGFLDALGVPAQRLPATADAQTALYRSLVVGKRMLVVLDNARDAAHVRPLLPGAPGCFVVVTSRNQLPGLVATDGVHPLILDLPTPAEARQMLALRIGAKRVAAEAQAADQIVDRCGRLPLALSIVAGRAASLPRQPLRHFAAELDDTRTGLEAFDVGDPGSDLRQVLSWSYRSLTPPAAKLFALLGLYPGASLGAAAAASLAGLPAGRVAPLLAELVRVHLLDRPAPGRYWLHDLIRPYAAELAGAIEAEARQAASARLLDHYLATANAAADLLRPGRETFTPPPSQPGAGSEPVSDLAAAMAWFAVEHTTLVGLVSWAGQVGFDAHAWQLAWALRDFLDRKCLWQAQLDVQHAGLVSAGQLGDRSAQARAHRSIGRTFAALDKASAAARHYRRAFKLFNELDDTFGQAHIHMSLGTLAQQQGDQAASLDHHQQALELFDRTGDAPGRGNALNNIAMNYLEMGNYTAALRHCTSALSQIRELGDCYAEASTWHTMGLINHHLHRYRRAIHCFHNTLRRLRQVGDRYHEALALIHLADAQAAQGNRTGMRSTLHHSLSILEDLDHPDAASVRARLADEPGQAVGCTGPGTPIRPT